MRGLFALLVALSLVYSADGAIDCQPCDGIDVDATVAATTARFCTSGQASVDDVQWEIERDPGGITSQTSGCLLTVSIDTQSRVRTRARFCDATETVCSEWSDDSPWVSQLIPVTCPADVDHDGDITGADFIVFRASFTGGTCP